MLNNKQKLVNGILFTDQYQLTMAQLYFRMGLHETDAQFDHFFRHYPDYGEHQAGYCINAGLEGLLDWMGEARFGSAEIACLRAQTNSTGEQVFADDFLQWLSNHSDFSSVDIRAIPEGRVVHPYIPLTVVRGPLAMAQILETPLLNHLNYPVLVATKAARMSESARGRPLMEFGLRRAQGMGGNAGTRAALIGGADFTSNIGMSHAMGLQPRGTHAHSMVQLFMALGLGELGAFRAYADIYPDDCLLLVDTVDTLESGIPNAIRVFEELRRKGCKPIGIRLDSGDFAYLSIQAAKLLNAAGFDDTLIVLSNDLDELAIWQIVTQIGQEASRYDIDADQLLNRLVYGAGTRLITSFGSPALGGVYKLVAVRNGNEWTSAMKISESPAKMPNPGQKQSLRLYDQRSSATADLLYLDDENPMDTENIVLRHPLDFSKQRTLPRHEISEAEPLLVNVLSQGKRVYETPSLADIRAQRAADVERLDPGIRRLINPHIYHVSLSQNLWNLKRELIRSAMEHNQA